MYNANQMHILQGWGGYESTESGGVESFISEFKSFVIDIFTVMIFICLQFLSL